MYNHQDIITICNFADVRNTQLLLLKLKIIETTSQGYCFTKNRGSLMLKKVVIFKSVVFDVQKRSSEINLT